MMTQRRLVLATLTSLLPLLISCGQSVQKELTLTISDGVLTLTTVSLPPTKVPDSGVCGGPLAAGLALSTDGVISGIPAEAFPTNTIMVIATGSSTVPLSAEPYNTTLEAVGGTPKYQWKVSSGALPSGIVLAVDTGALTGTPTEPGVFLFDITVTDSVGATVSASLSIDVAGVVTTNLPEGKAGEPYNEKLEVKGGTFPYTWSLKVCAVEG